MLVATGAAVALGAAFAISPDHVEDGPVICPFRRLTGLPCPGCGLTRSWVYLAHGRWGDAFAAHPFGLVAVARRGGPRRRRGRRDRAPTTAA